MIFDIDFLLIGIEAFITIIFFMCMVFLICLFGGFLVKVFFKFSNKYKFTEGLDDEDK